MKKKKVKVKYKKILFFLFIFGAGLSGIMYLFNLPIKNIYVINEDFLTEQEIIEIAQIENYPKSIFNGSNKIEEKLNDNIYIKSSSVVKKGLTQVYIEVEENKPVFYYENTQMTILADGTSVLRMYDVPHVINYVTDNIYSDFVEEISKIDDDVLKRITEIEFKPNEVDDSLFYLTMIDGNFVYVNLFTFDKLNMYLSIMSSLPDKEGILYLDYGNHFEPL